MSDQLASQSVDLLIRGGTVIDGTGGPGFVADVAVRDGVIVAVGQIGPEVSATELIDAKGLLVTPGFIDPHTHFDGQVMWDPLLSPSSWHGVTTVVMGNCGVGFAPVRPERRQWVIDLLDGVEDIPGTALWQGMTWDWETFPQYLDKVEAAPKAIDVAALIPHGVVRAYVMGDRGTDLQSPSEDDLAEMASIVREGLHAGALGVSTTHTLFHRSANGEYVPCARASEAELARITAPMAELGVGVYQIITSGAVGPEPAIELAPSGGRDETALNPATELRWMRDLSIRTGRPVTFTTLQVPSVPGDWKDVFRFVEEADRDGARLRPMVAARPVGLVLTLASAHPFQHTPTFASWSDLPLAEKVRRMRDATVRQSLLDEVRTAKQQVQSTSISSIPLDRIFPLEADLNFVQPRHRTPAAIAEREGRDPFDVLYDMLLAEDGHAFLLAAMANFEDYSDDLTREMLLHPQSIFGLSDAGAHCTVLIDASMPTYLLTYWARDRSTGRLPIETAVRMMTADPADLFGLGDRGRCLPGYKADLNIIDFERLRACMPEFLTDLPAGASRLVQRAEGYVTTIVAGQVIAHEGRDTGARPGRLVRGPQSTADA